MQKTMFTALFKTETINNLNVCKLYNLWGTGYIAQVPAWQAQGPGLDSWYGGRGEDFNIKSM